MKKIFSQKSFKYFVWTSLGSTCRVKHKDAIFALIALLAVGSLILFPLFATGHTDTSGKSTAGVFDI
jgi:hypothetical protein